MAPLAILPMYDWPETRSANDLLWHRLRASLQDRGFDAPADRVRPEDPFPVWEDENLLLGQTCGLPYMQRLKDKVSLVGTPAYGIECGAGSYFSVLIVREGSGVETLSDLQDACFGYNNPLSQSGFSAFYSHLKANGIPPDRIARGVLTGSHRQSVRAVAEGKVDIAAIDAVSWELARLHEPAAGKVRVLDQTDTTPGLPFITSRRPAAAVDRIHMAVVDAMASLDEEARDNLLLMGFAAMTEDDYRVIGDRYLEIADDARLD